MKTVVVIEDWINNLKIPADLPACKMLVPETWEDLKQWFQQAVKKDAKNYVYIPSLSKADGGIEEEQIVCDGKTIQQDGTILDEDNDWIAEGRTIKDMFLFILSIGRPVQCKEC